MRETKTIVVLGNCQAQMLESLMALASQDVTVKRLPPVFELGEQNRAEVVAAFEKADHIFAQRVSQDYAIEWVRPDWLRATFPHKVLVWPNIYFDGYFPDIHYIYRAPYGKVQGPLDDYHLRRVFDAHKAGRTVASAVDSVTRGEPRLDQNAFEKSLAQLRLREQDVDVTISDFVADEVGRRRAFYTPNHPCNFLLVEMARRLADRVDLLFSMERAETFGYALDKIYIPIYSAIIRSQSVTFAETADYRGRSVESATSQSIAIGDQKTYAPVELVEQFYRIYDAVFASAR
jgi:hypothetical protein